MLNVKDTLDATIVSLKDQGVLPHTVILNLIHGTLLAGQLKSAGLHDGIPEHLSEYEGMSVHLDPSPAGQSIVIGRGPGATGPVSQFLIRPTD